MKIRSSIALLAALAAHGTVGGTLNVISSKQKAADTARYLPESQPRHTPRGYGRPPVGWRRAESLRKHKEIQRRVRRNASK